MLSRVSSVPHPRAASDPQDRDPMELKTLDEIRHAVAGLTSSHHDALDRLVWTGVFGPAELRDAARAAVFDQARSAGVYPASIQALYLARGRGEAPSDFT